VADVPDQDVLGRLEDVVQGDGQFDHAQTGAEMAAGDRDGVDGLGPHLVRQLFQLGDVEPACRRERSPDRASGVSGMRGVRT
jgi:hypothetical protein